MIADARFAPKRTDLPWLRRRRLPRTAGAAASAPLQEFLTGHSHGEHHPFAAPEPEPSTSSLDLGERAGVPPVVASTSTSLELDEVPASVPVIAPPAAPTRPARVDARIHSGERLVLSGAEPTVTLTRLQTGIGTLTIEAATSDEVGDLRLGCAYELESGLELTMQMTQGSRLAPPHSKRPILLGSRDRFEKIGVDLRQCRELRRLIVYAFSANRTALRWGGTLLITTYGGERVEVPLESLQRGDLAVLLSIYQVHGEFVLRAELQTLYGDVREASRAYGYDKITWLDGRTPVE